MLDFNISLQLPRYVFSSTLFPLSEHLFLPLNISIILRVSLSSLFGFSVLSKACDRALLKLSLPVSLDLLLYLA